MRFTRFSGCKLSLPLLAAAVMAATAEAGTLFARVEGADTMPGYLARLLINEVPFPGERAYESETSTKEAMREILWVLDSRIHRIPKGYTQRQVAGVRSKNVIDVITGGGGRRQCEGFYQNAAGQFVTDARVEERLDYLLKIANSGEKPGRFAALLNHGQGLARAYAEGGMEGADRFASLRRVGPILVTGHAYSWMTDVGTFHPGGNFVTIPPSDGGALGGNRFFTLRKSPK